MATPVQSKGKELPEEVKRKAEDDGFVPSKMQNITPSFSIATSRKKREYCSLEGCKKILNIVDREIICRCGKSFCGLHRDIVAHSCNVPGSGHGNGSFRKANSGHGQDSKPGNYAY